MNSKSFHVAEVIQGKDVSVAWATLPVGVFLAPDIINASLVCCLRMSVPREISPERECLSKRGT